jgi:hypothetical protein
MAGLDPAIYAVPFRTHLAVPTQRHRVDGRVKHGHDNTKFCVLLRQKHCCTAVGVTGRA